MGERSCLSSHMIHSSSSDSFPEVHITESSLAVFFLYSFENFCIASFSLALGSWSNTLTWYIHLSVDYGCVWVLRRHRKLQIYSRYAINRSGLSVDFLVYSFLTVSFKCHPLWGKSCNVSFLIFEMKVHCSFSLRPLPTLKFQTHTNILFVFPGSLPMQLTFLTWNWNFVSV